MAAEYSIVEPVPDGDPLHTEIHECLRILRRLEGLGELVDELDTLRPLLAAWKRTNGGTVGVLRARKALRNGNQD